MFKAKVLTLITAMTVSLSAQAGFVQYDFANVNFTNGGTVTGYFVQDTDDKSIAYYQFAAYGPTVGISTFPSRFYNDIVSADSRIYGMGPTNFRVLDNLSEAYSMVIDLQFFDLETPGRYSVGGWLEAFPMYEGPNFSMTYSFERFGGFVTEGVIDPLLLAELETGRPIDGMSHIVPTEVPEPVSFALLAVAAAGLYSVRRRKAA